ncbi:DMT family transporter [Exiguobacterium mexicanum]|uniref:DMT family transporter n=1 Tax=Exiguobacterium mexicanum TaxID=340146 RepID=A0ABT7MQH8_9BACL|nr:MULTISPECIES: DMT family transporter [Exiguobacterium]MDL5377464.1 DMT family transporter [Exiguobacterium mexicanum]
MPNVFQRPWTVTFLALFNTFLWGSAFPFIKLSYEALDIQEHEYGQQLFFAGERFLLAGLLLLVISRLVFKRPIRLTAEKLKAYAHLGAFLTFLQYLFFYVGLSISTGVQGSIIAGSTSFFQMALAHFRYEDDRLNRLKGIALTLGFSGIVIANWPTASTEVGFGIGEILLILAMISGAFGNLVAKDYSRSHDVAPMTAWAMVIGSLGLLIVGYVLAPGDVFLPYTVTTLFFLLYLALLSAVGFTLWNTLMKYNPVSRVSLYMFFVPLFGVVLSSVLLGETIPWNALVGLLFVIAGIYLSTYFQGRANRGVR